MPDLGSTAQLIPVTGGVEENESVLKGAEPSCVPACALTLDTANPHSVLGFQGVFQSPDEKRDERRSGQDDVDGNAGADGEQTPEEAEDRRAEGGPSYGRQDRHQGDPPASASGHPAKDRALEVSGAGRDDGDLVRD
ncbi:hypothetical protein OG458_11965 [Streptomyces sp. NBC_01281]|uniref:hypothetical protein n=1 Tax=unclassified Streptomyces TaxID=2593676 RepID=UPI0013B62648|nr:MULTISPECIES: hypothetical protein [unclassified Streptomyces]NEB34255.1 hypothetical protein [Streptomyces sp. SID14446]WSK60557.1 hypothetical protein OG458_11965 [Streptomyces sp. NBC_01281]